MPTNIGTKEISEGATDRISWDWTPDLDGDELVASATVVEVGSSDLTLTSLAGSANVCTVNAATVEINGKTVAIGKATECMISGQKAGRTYILKITGTTDSTPARVLPREHYYECV